MVYLALWCRVFDEGIDAGLIEVRDEKDFAVASGFTADRGVRTWRERLRALETLGFIRIERHWGDDAITHILILDPDMAVKNLEKRRGLPDSWRRAYERRCEETKATRWRPRRESHAIGMQARPGMSAAIAASTN
jgi:hypothetical protein